MADQTRWLLAAAFTATVAAANLTVALVGILPVGFGLTAPAGVAFAGLAFILRDELQRTAGRRWALAAITAGVLLSLATAGPALALASAAAFAAAELVDMAVYTAAREGLAARLLSNTIAAPVDTIVFLSLAGFGLATPVVAGQILVKAIYLAPLAVALWWWTRRREVPRAVPRQRQLRTGA